MIRNAILALALVGAGAASAQKPDPEPRVENPSPPAQRMTAADFARNLTSHLPRQFSAGITLTGAAAEADVLILTVASEQAFDEGDRALFLAGVVQGMCRGGTSAIFSQGVGLRIVAVMPGSAPYRSEVVRRCPG